MDWINGIQQALNYIEDHLDDELDYQKIAAAAGSSSFHFQRIFSLLCNMTLGKYIRSRRMSLAGRELATKSCKVIDIAMKYGYDSPESFSRAFTRFHGISPSLAKSCPQNLKFFSRLSVQLTTKGGSIMDYRIEKKDAFRIIEKVKNFSTSNEEHTAKIPAFWNEAMQDSTIDTLCTFCEGEMFNHQILGICYKENEQNEMEYAIASAYNGAPVPQGYRVSEVKASTWAIFSSKGKVPQSLQETWKRVYTEYFPASEYVPTNEIDFEVYPEGDMNLDSYCCEIWIAVKKTN